MLKQSISKYLDTSNGAVQIAPPYHFDTYQIENQYQETIAESSNWNVIKEAWNKKVPAEKQMFYSAYGLILAM